MFSDSLTCREIAGNASFYLHTREWDLLYGIDVLIHPRFQGSGFAVTTLSLKNSIVFLPNALRNLRSRVGINSVFMAQ